MPEQVPVDCPTNRKNVTNKKREKLKKGSLTINGRGNYLQLTTDINSMKIESYASEVEIKIKGFTVWSTPSSITFVTKTKQEVQIATKKTEWFIWTHTNTHYKNFKKKVQGLYLFLVSV